MGPDPKLEAQIEQVIATYKGLAATASILRSAPGTSPVASTMLISEMPEHGQITSEQAGALSAYASADQARGLPDER